MTAIDDSVPAVVERLLGVLESSGALYAFGGAIALAAWSEPRATADVDVILWIEPGEIDRAIEIVRRAGVEVDDVGARTAAAQHGMLARRVGATRVDVFVPSIPFCDEAARRRVRTTLAVRGPSFDRGFVRASLVEMLDDDPRIAKWDEICGRVP